MKRLIVLLTFAAPFLLTQVSWATQLDWTGGSGAGSNNLPCTDGAHWVLSPSGNITSATLTFNGHDYAMVKTGSDSFTVDTDGPVVVGDHVHVGWVGRGNPTLTLSYCITTSPSPSPSGTPSPTGS